MRTASTFAETMHGEQRAAPFGLRSISPVQMPFFEIFEHAFQRLLPEGAGFARAVFSLNDAAEIERLVHDAGFRDVAVKRDDVELRLPGAREFFRQYIQSTPLAALVRQADAETVAAIEREVIAGWRPWVRDGGMVYEQRVHVATARKPAS